MNMINREKFRKRLSEVIEEQTIEEFKKDTGLTDEKIMSMTEDISSVYADDLIPICTKYRVSMDWLLGYDTDKTLITGE